MALTDDTPIPDYANMLRLDGKGVVVFGAGQGIGRQAAHAAASVGARVACVDLALDRAESVAAEVRGTAHAADVIKPGEVDRVLAEAQDALGGRIDAIIDIVGMPRYIPIIKCSDEDWDFQIDMCLKQAFQVMRAGARLMRETGGGAMAFVSSVSGYTGAPHHAPYGAAKAGLDSLVRSAGAEFARYNIRVNAIAPGLTWTPRVSTTLDAEGLAEGERTIPMRRPGQPSEIASGLLFMISNLSTYVTGQVLRADGGATGTFPISLGAGPGVKR